MTLEEERLYGPFGVRWPALLSAVILIGVVFAPAGAVACAVLAFLANHPIQKQWRSGFIILAAVFVITSVTGSFLLKPKKGEGGPFGGDGVTGLVMPALPPPAA